MCRKLVFLLLYIILPILSSAQHFDHNIRALQLFVLANELDFAVTEEGKTYVVGDFNNVNDRTCFGLTRLNENSTTDESFDIGMGFDDRPYRIRLMADGKLMVMGFFHNYQGKAVHSLVRLNDDGSLDETFDMGTGPGPSAATDLISDVHELANGQLIVLGNFISINGFESPGVARLNADGSVDETFSTSAIEGINFASISTMQDNEQLIVQVFRTGLNQTQIIRLNLDGSLDETFTPHVVTTNNYQLALQSTGKIVVAATGSIVEKDINGFYRLNPDGSLDDSFDIGEGTTSTIRHFAINDADQILLASPTSFDQNPEGLLIVLDADGSYIESLLTGDGPGDNVFLEPDGDMLVSGQFLEANHQDKYGLARIKANKTLDEFRPHMKKMGGGTGFAISPEGNMLLSGRFKYSEGIYWMLAYIRRDDFGYSGASGWDNEWSEIVKMESLSDGSVGIAGNFPYFQYNIQDFGILSIHGTSNGEFEGGTGFIGPGVWDFDEFDDGTLIIGGDYEEYNEIEVNSLIKVRRDGSVVDSFQQPFGMSLTNVLAVAALPEGKALISAVGDFGNGVVNQIFRLNADGSLDGTFSPSGPQANAVRLIEVLPDGRYLLGGNFSDYEEKAALVLMNEDGTLDENFTVNLMSDGGATVRDIEVINEDIYVVGQFRYNGEEIVNGFMKIDLTGQMDSDFRPTTGYGTDIRSITLGPSGHLFVTGAITDQVNGYASNYSRVIEVPEGNITELVVTEESADQVVINWTGSVTGHEGYLIERTLWGGELSEYARVPADATSFTDTNLIQLDTYVYRVTPYISQLRSKSSNEVFARVPLVPPNKPSGVTIEFVSGSELNISWRDNSDNEEGFILERAQNGVGFTEVAELLPNVETYSDTDLVTFRHYHYRIKAFNEAGSSSYSEEAHFFIPPIPAAPHTLQVEIYLLENRLNWIHSSPFEDRFIMERATGTGEFQVIDEIADNTSRFTDADVLIGETYTYRIKAANITGESDYSNEVEVMVTSLENGGQGTDSAYKLMLDRTTHELTFELQNQAGIILESQVLNGKGINQSLVSEIQNNRVKFNVSSLSQGIYLLQVNTNLGRQVVKFLINF